MSLLKQNQCLSEMHYPKMHRDCAGQLRGLLAQVSGLSQTHCQELAMAINDMADKANDLNEILERLLEPGQSSATLGDLLIAFELTTEQLRGASDVIDGKLFDIGDQLKGLGAKDLV